jgi:hypothetical protein
MVARYVRDLGCGRDQERTQRRIATYGSGRSHSNFYDMDETQLAIIFAMVRTSYSSH